MGGRIILRGIGLGVAAMLLNVAVAFLWVWIYSLALAPGHDGGFYQAYAQRVAPVSSILAGVPLLLGAGYLAARGDRPLLASLIPAGAYILLDFVLMVLGGLSEAPVTILISYVTKIAAAALGGLLRQKRRAA